MQVYVQLVKKVTVISPIISIPVSTIADFEIWYSNVTIYEQ